MNEQFLSLLSSGYILVELFKVIAGTRHELLGRGKIALRKFLERQRFSGKVEIVGNTASGNSIAAINFDLAAKIPFENAASLHVEKMTAAGYLGKADEPDSAETFAENEIQISIISGNDLESQFEDEPGFHF